MSSLDITDDIKTTRRPMISAMMLVRDRAEMLKQAAQAVLCQSYADFELIILDDGSKDDTWAVCQKLAEGDARVCLMQNENSRGIPAARNQVLEKARGKYLVICDSDDISRENRFELQVAKLEHDVDLVGVGARINAFDGNDPSSGAEPNWHWGLKDGRLPFAFPSAMFRTDALRAVKGFNENYKIAEDLHLCYRLAAAEGCFSQVNEILLDYRAHTGSITKAKARTREWCTLKAQCAGLRLLRGRFSLRGYAVLIQSVIRLFLAMIGVRK